MVQLYVLDAGRLVQLNFKSAFSYFQEASEGIAGEAGLRTQWTHAGTIFFIVLFITHIFYISRPNVHATGEFWISDWVTKGGR